MSLAELVVSEGHLRSFTRTAADRAGLERSDAELFVNAIVEADLRGIDTHGCIRIPAYVRGVISGKLNAKPELRRIGGRGATLVLDGDNGLGVVTGQRAMDIAADLAADHGVGIVAMPNCNHAGMLAVHVLRALPRGMIGYFVSNGPAVMAPWGGRDPRVSNNPFAYAFPTKEELPIVVDMACSAAARGKVRLAAQKNEKIPTGWAMDAEGRPTVDAHAAMAGVVLPMAGHKGYAIAFANELLSACLSGALLSADISRAFLSEGATTLDAWSCGHLVMAIDISAFGDLEVFRARVDAAVRSMKSSATAPGFDEILTPGEPEWRERKHRLESGIPIAEPVVRMIDQMAAELGIGLLSQ